jgi:hypothetical protein
LAKKFKSLVMSRLNLELLLSLHVLRRVENSINHCHHPLRNLSVLFLLSDCPCSCSPCQSPSICTHEPPWLIDKAANDLSGTGIQIFLNSVFCILKCLLNSFAVAVLAPAPILKGPSWAGSNLPITVTHHFNWETSARRCTHVLPCE